MPPIFWHKEYPKSSFIYTEDAKYIEVDTPWYIKTQRQIQLFKKAANQKVK